MVTHYLTLVLEARLKEKKQVIVKYLKGKHGEYEAYAKMSRELDQIFGNYCDKTPHAKLINGNQVLKDLITKIHAPFFTKGELEGHDLQCKDADGVPLKLGDYVIKRNERYKTLFYKIEFMNGQPVIVGKGNISMALFADTCTNLDFVIIRC